MSEHLSDPTARCCTFVGLLRWRALNQPYQRAYTYLVDGEAEEIYLSYAELDRQARAIGALLQHNGLSGQRALLLYPPGVEYIAALFGCLYAGVVAVPAYPPDPAQLNRTLPRLQAILNDAQPLAALTTTPVLSLAEGLSVPSADLKSLHWLATDNVSSDWADEWREPATSRNTLAFLQYTSGSTSAPKGVMLTHGNLLHNSALIHRCFEHSSESRGVIWLPPYHDMGLIGGILQPLYGGFPVTLMSPLAFLQRPYRWLLAISRHKATTSGGPNFAYELCVRKITPDQRVTLDLSSWDVAFNGSEPVRNETMERFAATFRTCGFRKEAFYPCYGLAEATLIVSGGAKAAPPVARIVKSISLGQNRVEAAAAGDADTQTLVGCGRSLTDQKIVIANPETHCQRAPGEIGEIWVSGPSVAQGYWNRPDETACTFHAHLSSTGEGPYLRTGDLGFLQQGELFVTGRLKDLIIIRGQNHYPQDIERSVEQSHPALRPGCGAAFSVEAGGEARLVVAQEVRSNAADLNLTEIIQTIRQSVAAQHELQVYGVLLLRPRSIPKTSSGKIQRHACREDFLSDSLNVLAKSIRDVPLAEAPSGQAEESFIRRALTTVDQPSARRSLLTLYLQEQVARVLRLALSQIDPQQPLSGLGLDSLMAVELRNEVEMGLGIVLPISEFLQGASIAQIGDSILAQLAGPVVLRDDTSLVPTQETVVEFPLSYGQRALWFLHQLAPESPAYNIAVAIRTGSGLDVLALRRALQALVDRHPAWRTTFTTRQGELIQRVNEHVVVHFEEEDASNWSEALLNARLVEEAHRPFVLEQGPLLRVHLFRRPSQEHVLLLVMHHIIADLWSLAVLVQELDLLYPAVKAGTQIPLPPLDLQYTDYVRWQAEMLAGPKGERLWDYWQNQLAGELPVLDLPTDKPRPSIQTYCGATCAFEVDEELTQQLKALARTEGATLYMVLLAAFQALLYRYTGQEDILVGSPTTGRNRAKLADVVGYFVNPVVLRADLSGNPAFSVFLKRVRQTVLAAFEHQEYPLTLLIERLQPKRDPSRSALFQVMLVLQRTHMLSDKGVEALALGRSGAQLKVGDISLESIALEQQIAQFDLTLMLAEVEERLIASLQYNTDLFEAATINRMARHFQTLLKGIVVNPDQRLSELPLLTQAERHQLLVERNSTQVEYRQAMCIHHLFERQVTRTPDAVAVIFGDQHLTYRELNRRANQLAHYLRALGVGPEVLVGIFVERSMEMVVSMLGILKAGGAYVPLDPAYPKERLAFILADTQAPVLLTQRRLVKQLPSHAAQVVCLDTGWETIAQASQANLAGKVTAENLAYVIYTSGSTGRPKGVAIEHHSTAALIHWAYATYAQELLGGTLASTSLCFDLSVFELFVPLSWGGTVILVETALHLPTSPAAEAVILVNTVPSVMRELLHLGRLPGSVRVVNLAGEPLPTQLVRQIHQQETIQQVFDLYGPSEDTTYSTYALRNPAGPATIGRPISNTQVYILDANLNPVPAGVPGELYIGGAGLARGYHKRPWLTAERFVPNPFSTKPGARLYRTGDLVRYLPDGNLEFLGRADHQVKIRGYRIELGEIETVLVEHPSVRESVVLVREDALDDKRLVAYIVAEQGHNPTTGELYHFLQQKLPEYMVPSAFLMLESLPLTPSGKIDRQALPTPDTVRPELDSVFAIPRTPGEEALAEIWAEVLGFNQIGIHDNFFELGGHSLLVTRVLTRVREEFRVELPAHSLFRYSTVADMAKYIETVRWATQNSQVLRSPLTSGWEEGKL